MCVGRSVRVIKSWDSYIKVGDVARVHKADGNSFSARFPNANFDTWFTFPADKDFLQWEDEISPFNKALFEYIGNNLLTG